MVLMPPHICKIQRQKGPRKMAIPADSGSHISIVKKVEYNIS